jgi:hypothetical protein
MASASAASDSEVAFEANQDCVETKKPHSFVNGGFCCVWKRLVVEGIGEEGAATGEGDNSEGDAGREEQPGGGLGGDADREGDGAEDVLRGGVGAALDLKEAGVDALGDGGGEGDGEELAGEGVAGVEGDGEVEEERGVVQGGAGNADGGGVACEEERAGVGEGRADRGVEGDGAPGGCGSEWAGEGEVEGVGCCRKSEGKDGDGDGENSATKGVEGTGHLRSSLSALDFLFGA